jgi:hypothetical protein
MHRVVLSGLIGLAALSCSPAKSKERPTAAMASTPASATASTAKAAPHARRLPTLSPARFTLAIAESEDTPAAWTAVADGYAQQLADCDRDCIELAREVALARSKAARAALHPEPDGDDWTPLEIPAEYRAAIDANDQLLAMLDTTDMPAIALQFTTASVLYRYRQNDAIPRLEALLRDHRDNPIAEYAANELLDALRRANRTDELRTWVTELAADETFLANKPVLRETLQRMQQVLAG